jgi:hypothetical protein
MSEKANFEFYNSVAPRYLEPLFLKIEFGEWYSIAQLIDILQRDLQVGGKEIVLRNVDAWSGLGFGESRIDKQKAGKRIYFRISPLGHYLQEIYSTNVELFYDLMHYFFYSTWFRSQDIQRVRFWVYAQVCNELWLNAPTEMDSFKLASKVQSLALDDFPNYNSSISERSIRAGFPWFGKLSPPFLQKLGTKRELTSEKRSYCNPQLFHLAIDLLYTRRQLTYGTSLNIDDEIIKEISMTCLLDSERFWEMTERTQMMVKGFEVRKSQWGPTITLSHVPNWIELPDFQNQSESNDKGSE